MSGVSLGVDVVGEGGVDALAFFSAEGEVVGEDEGWCELVDGKSFLGNNDVPFVTGLM